MTFERKMEEFWCDPSGGGCSCYFTTFLRSTMSGAYTIECPNCKHHHYRHIDHGLITTSRDYRAKEQKEIIIGLGPVSRTPFHQDPDFRRSLLKTLKP